MLADLHLHSVYSDGLYTPDEICRRAKAKGLSLLSITDHDTLAGEEDKFASAKKHGLKYISGWEISAFEGSIKIHILGYGCTPCEAYYRFMEDSKKRAFTRIEQIVENLQKQGFSITIEEALAERIRSDLPLHVMHLARALGKKLNMDESEAYSRYLSYGKPAYSNYGRTTPKEAIDCIHACGGVTSIAHPGRITLDFSAREKLLKEIVALGAEGIECFYTTHTKEDEGYFQTLANKWGLYITGGSDTHVEEKDASGGHFHRIGVPSFTPDERFLSRFF